MTVFEHRTREVDGPDGSIYPGPSIIAGGSPVAPAAPIGASYVTTALDAGLSSERVLTAGTNIALADGGAGGTLTITSESVPTPNQYNLPGQNSDIATTSMLVAPAAGQYLVEAYLMCTTADAAAGTLTITVGWTDAVGATTSSPITLFSLATTGRTTGRQAMRVASGDITFAVSITGGYGTSQYALHFRIVSIG